MDSIILVGGLHMPVTKACLVILNLNQYFKKRGGLTGSIELDY